MNVLYFGNKLLIYSGSVSLIEELLPKLNEKYSVRSYSSYKSKVLRLLHMWVGLLINAKRANVVLIDSYSSPLAFFYLWSLSIGCRILCLKYIPILHGGNFPDRLSKWPGLCRHIFAHSALNVSPSGYLQAALKKHGYECQVIPNAIAIENFNYLERELVKPRMLWVRSFDQKTYNPSLAVKVLSILENSGMDAELCMVGGDKDGSMNLCRKEAEKKGISSKLKLMGKLSKREWLALSEQYDVFINTTNIDNTPFSLIEAMALGLPIVSTNVGGIPFLLYDELNGLLVPPNDPYAFSEAVKRLVSDHELARKISNNGRKKAIEFSWEEVMPKWYKLLDTFL